MRSRRAGRKVVMPSDDDDFVDKQIIVIDSDEEDGEQNAQAECVNVGEAVALSVAERVRKYSRNRKSPVACQGESENAPEKKRNFKKGLKRKAMKEIQNSPDAPSQGSPLKMKGAPLKENQGSDEEECAPEPSKKKKPGPAINKCAKRAAPKKQAAAPSCNDDIDDFAQEPVTLILDSDEEEEKSVEACEPEVVLQRKADKLSVEAYFRGRPIPAAQAKRRWPHRYGKDKPDKGPQCAEHYEEAVVDGETYKLGDCVNVNGDGSQYLGKVLEFFRITNNENWFRIQWFFRFSDTTIGTLENVSMDNRRIFCSKEEDDNFLECITGKITVSYISPSDYFLKRDKVKLSTDYYFDMGYRYDLSTFHNVSYDNSITQSSDEHSSVYNEAASEQGGSIQLSSSNDIVVSSESESTELSLLDLYSGCGGMSTGLCMGTALGGIKLVTRWALDLNEHACDSMRCNHPETEVRNEDAESFLKLLKEWQRLCSKYEGCEPVEDVKEDNDGRRKLEPDEYEVEKVVGIRMAPVDKSQSKKPDTSSRVSGRQPKRQLEFKVRWKGFTADCDTWEPSEHLDECQERIRDFVLQGRKKRILPLPGEVHMICGGPPCQGASGYNRFRNSTAPLECPRNRQMVIYMDIVEFLKPKYVLLENVVDILKFCGGILGRYAMFRLVSMHYQAKLGLMVAGSYGLPQVRTRVFLWGAAPSEVLPAFPLPTHHFINKSIIPNEFARNYVHHAEESSQLERALVLGDAISDLPPVENFEKRNEMPYGGEPKTAFQRFIRGAKDGFYTRFSKKGKNQTLHDHRPLHLNQDDYQRTCQIPHEKGANFRLLRGVRVREDNVAELDPDIERVYLPSGKPLVPDYAISFVKGRSQKPFGRLWWDECVNTVVTRAEPHNQILLHPVQDRVLTIRENARIQGFPDWYKLSGPVKERYIQIGNAVAVPVARALGYSLALAVQRSYQEPLLELPKGFPLF